MGLRASGLVWGGVGLGASDKGWSLCDPEFNRKFDQMFEIIEWESGGRVVCECS